MSISSEPGEYDSHDDDTDTENQHLLSSNTVVHDNQNGISWYFAVFLIVNAALGAGLLNFPKSFDNAGGILVSTIFHLILIVIVVGALFILSYCTDRNGSANFQDVIYSMCGKKWQTLNSIFIILYMFGCCVTFLILIGDQLSQVITCIFGHASLDHWFFNRKITVTITSLLFILPLCYPKRIDFLTYPSTFAVIAVVYVVILIPVKYYTLGIKNVIVKTRPDNWTDVFDVIPTICFGYQCHVNAVPVYACLKRKNLREFSKAIIVSFILLFFCYQIAGMYGYMTFGIKISDNLLNSYDSSDPSVLIAIIMYLFKTLTSYPLNLFCARTAIEGLWVELLRLDRQRIVENEKKRRVFIVTVWYLLSLLIALFVPNITFVIRYLGALAAAFMFIFPGLCLLFVVLNSNVKLNNSDLINSINSNTDMSMSEKKTKMFIFISVLYVTIGTFIVGLVITKSLLNDLKI